MSLARMQKIEIYALLDERERLLKTLQDLAVIEITDFVGVGDDGKNSPDQNENIYINNGELDNRISEIGRSLGFLEQIVPVKPGIIEQFAGIKTFLTPVQYENYLKQAERLDEVMDQLIHLESELAQMQVKRNQFLTVIQTLNPWESLSFSNEALSGTQTIQVLLGSTQFTAAEIKTALDGLEQAVYFETVHEASQNTLFVLVVERVNFNPVLSALSKFNLTSVNLPAFETTVAGKIQELTLEIEKLNLAEAKNREKVTELAAEKPLLQVFYDSLINERYRNDEAVKLIYAQNCYGVSGWIPEDKIQILQDQLNKENLKYVLKTKTPEEGEVSPTILLNNNVLSPFEYLVQSFSFPQAHEVDPTPLIAPFFFIFFGIALGDAGYGVILSLICAVFLVKIKMGPVGKRISWMFLLSGLGAVVVGILTGSVLSLPNLKFGLFNPLENPILLLVIVLALGLIQLYLGVIVSAWSSIKERRWADVFWNQGFWLFFLTSVILVLGKDAFGLSQYSTTFTYLLMISAAGLIIGNTRGKKGIIKKLLAIPGGLFTIYGSIGFFSDVLSYSRLMALGLSGGVMGGIMNQLAWMVVENVPFFGWIIGGLIFLFGHTLNLALSVLGAYVHSSRLQYLEFFGKFYEGGGKPFTPFKNKPKYTFLINEREAN